MQTRILIDSRLIEEPTRKQLIQKLNKLLNTKFNWSRLNRLDLERLVTATEKLIDKFARVGLK